MSTPGEDSSLLFQLPSRLASLRVVIVCLCSVVPQCGCPLPVRRNDNGEKVQGGGVYGGWLQRRHQCLAGQHPPSHPWLSGGAAGRADHYAVKALVPPVEVILEPVHRYVESARCLAVHGTYLLLRGASPIDTFELTFLSFEDSNGWRVNLWVQHVQSSGDQACYQCAHWL